MIWSMSTELFLCRVPCWVTQSYIQEKIFSTCLWEKCIHSLESFSPSPNAREEEAVAEIHTTWWKASNPFSQSIFFTTHPMAWVIDYLHERGSTEQWTSTIIPAVTYLCHLYLECSTPQWLMSAIATSHIHIQAIPLCSTLTRMIWRDDSLFKELHHLLHEEITMLIHVLWEGSRCEGSCHYQTASRVQALTRWTDSNNVVDCSAICCTYSQLAISRFQNLCHFHFQECSF